MHERPERLVTLAVLGVLSVAYPVAGSVIVSSLPRHVVGWLLVLAGFAMSLVSIGGAYGLSGQGRPGVELAAWLASWIFVPALSLAGAFLLLLFPTGTLPSTRWRPLAVALAVLAAATAVGYAFRPGELAVGGGIQNPFGIQSVGSALEILARAGDVLFPMALVAALGSMVARYRRAGPEEREQLKWFAYAATVLVVGVGIANLPLGEAALVGWVIAAVAIAALPVTVAIAIFKYRLYDIDLIISETLIYVGLVAILGGLFTASIAFFQRLFIALTGDTSDAAIVLTALIVAGVLTPIRKALEGTVERRFKRTPDPVLPNENGDSLISISGRLDSIESRLAGLERARATRSRTRRTGAHTDT